MGMGNLQVHFSNFPITYSTSPSNEREPFLVSHVQSDNSIAIDLL